MARVRDNLQQSLQTILALLPRNFVRYPPDDQQVLNKLLLVLDHYKEADYDRKQLAQRILSLRLEVLGSEPYLHTPFYWCIGTFLKNAHLLLQMSKYHATEFYGYLIRILRGAPQKKGIFQLTRSGTPFGNLAWEELQFESNKRLISLTEEQLQILAALSTLILNTEIFPLDPVILKDHLFEQAKSISKDSPTHELVRLFSLIDARWFFQFYSPAFGLERLFVRFKLDKSTKVESIIDCTVAQNTTLRVSDIYHVKDQPNSYLGVLMVPGQDLDQIMTHFRSCEEDGIISLADLTKISRTQRSTSLRLYHTKTGWIHHPPSKLLKRLSSILTSKDSLPTQEEPLSLFFPPSFNSQWHFTQHPLPTQIIKLYCRNAGYSNLPLFPQMRSGNQLTILEIGLLKQLYYKRILNVGYIPWYLVEEFSLDLYCVFAPTISLSRLKYLLNLLPFSEIHFGKEITAVMAPLTSSIRDWIQTYLHWKVLPISHYYNPITLQFNWYDEGTLQWKSPHIVKKRG